MSPALTVPSYLWNGYVDYLWNYNNNSWVATIAYGFRIWAILAILPTVVLCLLDVTSYVIARTLGDPTASTSHKSSFAQTDPFQSDPKVDTSAATVLVTAPSPSIGEGAGPTCAVGAIAEPTDNPAETAEAHLATYFADGEGEDDGAARLAGVGVFSPVASMPGSPTLNRQRSFLRGGEEEDSPAAQIDGYIRRRGESEQGGHERTASGGSGVNGGGESTSGESSFTLLEREESFEDPAAAHIIRRRVPGPTAAGADDD